MGIAQSEGTSKSHRLQKQAERTEAIHWKRDTLEMLKPIFVGTTDACPIGSPKKSLSTWIRMSLGRFSNSFLKSTSGTKVRWVQEKTFLPETREWTPWRCKKALFNQCGSRQHYAIKCSAIQSQSGAAKSVGFTNTMLVLLSIPTRWTENQPFRRETNTTVSIRNESKEEILWWWMQSNLL